MAAHSMAILCARGDIALAWDTEDAVQVDEVKTQFDEMMSQGFMAYADGKPTREFDPQARETIVSPVIAGG